MRSKSVLDKENSEWNVREQEEEREESIRGVENPVLVSDLGNATPRRALG